MSLAVWLPFTENIDTQGLENIKFSAVDSCNASLVSGGKIGKCYSSSSGALVSETKIRLGPQLSMFAWVNPDSLGNMAVCGQLRGTAGANNSGGTGACLSINSSGAIVATIGTTYLVSKNSMVTKGVWTHIGFTLYDRIVKLYKNGLEVYSDTLGSRYAEISDFFGVFGGALIANSSSNPRSVNTSNIFKGKLNDVRAFSHACSAKEVKEMAKGLVLHYKFDDKSITGATIYDCSGYRNHGNVNGTLTSDTDAGRYTSAIYFPTNPANYISVRTAPNIAPSLTACTIAWWEKPVTGKSMLISGGNSTTYIAACQETGTLYNSGVTGNPVYYKDGIKTPDTSMKYTAGEWHHYAITDISMTSFKNMIINNYVGNSSWCVNGRLNDLRIYSTVLSAEDIEALAKVQAAVDSSGNVYTFEYKEV